MMEFIRGLTNILPQHQGCYLTIGNFDGVHLGHQAVLKELVSLAEDKGVPSMAMIFEPSPKEYLLKAECPARITRLREKVEYIKRLGVDKLLCLRFNASMAELSADDFVTKILWDKLKINSLLIGDDFHFGKNRAGHFDTLQKSGNALGFTVNAISTVIQSNTRVSSSMIRSALHTGDFKSANTLLSRPFSMIGRVIHGQKRGRLMGVPTANIPIWQRKSPVNGVFAVRIHGIDDRIYEGVASVGTQPAVGGERELLETYVFNYSGDLYSKILQIEFLKKLRDICDFSSFASLSDQIHRDIQTAKEYFE